MSDEFRNVVPLRERCMDYDLRSRWTCSMRVGHSGMHKAYAMHDLNGELFKTWPYSAPKTTEETVPSEEADDTFTPEYYQGEHGIQPFDIIDAFTLGFNLGNVIKYVCRAGRKGDALSDLTKARTYLNREIRKLTKERGEIRAGS